MYIILVENSREVRGAIFVFTKWKFCGEEDGGLCEISSMVGYGYFLELHNSTFQGL